MLSIKTKRWQSWQAGWPGPPQGTKAAMAEIGSRAENKKTVNRNKFFIFDLLFFIFECPRKDSNPQLEFRRLARYPLRYGGIILFYQTGRKKQVSSSTELSRSGSEGGKKHKVLFDHLAPLLRASVVEESKVSSPPFANARVVDELRSSSASALARLIEESKVLG